MTCAVVGCLGAGPVDGTWSDEYELFLELVEANTAGIVDAVERVARDPRRRRSGDPRRDDRADEGDEEGGTEAGESVASAYESMVWRDSTDDGIDGGMLDV